MQKAEMSNFIFCYIKSSMIPWKRNEFYNNYHFDIFASPNTVLNESGGNSFAMKVLQKTNKIGT